MKTKMSLVGICAMVCELKSLVGFRLQNIFTVTNIAKSFIFKFNKKDNPAVNVFLESGVRLHITNFNRAKDERPSSFTAQLRKYVRNRLLTAVEQVGDDRVLMFKFEGRERSSILILEMYASGNIVLTDGDFRIIGLLRTHDYDDTMKVRVGAIYPVNLTSRLCTAPAPTSLPPAPATASTEKDASASVAESPLLTWETLAVSPLQAWILQQRPTTQPIAAQDAGAPNGNPHNKHNNKSKNKGKGKTKNKPTPKKKKKSNRVVLKRVLSGAQSPVAAFGPDLVEHCLLLAGADPDTVISAEWQGLDEACATKLVDVFRQMPQLLQRIKTVRRPGYILLRPDASSTGVPENTATTAAAAAAAAVGEPANAEKQPDQSQSSNDQLYYDQVVPMLLEQHKAWRHKQFSSFNAAVDEFFSLSETRSLERQRLRQKQQEAKQLDKVKHGLDNRKEALRDNAAAYEHAAYLVELNAELVDAAISVIRGALANSISWSDIKQLVEQQKQLGHPVAQIISRLKLEENVIMLRLPDPDNEGAHVTAQIDVTLSSYANANALHAKSKVAKSKLAKTVQMAAEALESAKRKIERQKKKKPVKQEVQVIRKKYWFEKFHWFIAPGDYVVVSGQSAQQNELLVKRYLRKGDAYVHADLRGASSCIVINHKQGHPIPPSVLEMAGTMTVCRSVAWSAGVIANAWWVEAHQVSKTAPSGEYLTTGSFMIRGKKTFLHPKRLEMGMSMLFVRKRKDPTTDEPLSPAPDAAAETDEKDGADTAEVAAATVDATSSVETSAPDIGNANDQQDDSPAAAATAPAVALDSEAVAVATGTADPPVPAVPPVVAPAFSSEGVAIHTRRAAPQDPDDLAAERAASMSQYERYQKQLREKQREAESERREQKAREKQQQQREAMAGNKKARRGRKGKMKRMKARYGDQDEEERKLRMALLGNPVKSNKGKRKGKKGKQMRQQQLEKDKAKLNNEEAKEDAAVHQTEKKDVPPASASPHTFSGDTTQPPQVQVDALFEEKKKQDLAAQLCRTPTDTDDLLHCLPMCAPYAAIQGCKYKVKLVPGKMKRGKACKAVMGMFRGSKLCTAAEEKLFQQLGNDQTMVRCILSDTKVVPAQSLQVSKSKKKNKKKQKKQKNKNQNQEKKNQDQKKANPMKQKKSKKKKKKKK